MVTDSCSGVVIEYVWTSADRVVNSTRRVPSQSTRPRVLLAAQAAGAS